MPVAKMDMKSAMKKRLANVLICNYV